MEVFRGEIWFADLGEEHSGSEQYGERPILIIQNNIGNKYSSTTIAALITSQINKAKLPTHMNIQLYVPSVILLEQIRTIDKKRLQYKMCELSDLQIKELNEKLKISVAC